MKVRWGKVLSVESAYQLKTVQNRKNIDMIFKFITLLVLYYLKFSYQIIELSVPETALTTEKVQCK